MKNYPCYIHINYNEGYVYSTGIEFSVFINSIPKNFEGILILKGNPINAEVDNNSLFEYVNAKNISSLINENVYNFGDFCWVDYKLENDMKIMNNYEISNLLFTAHMKKPLDVITIKFLENNYLYLCHDDMYWVKVYMKNLKDYKMVIESKIRSVLIGRRKSMNPIPDNILDMLYNTASNGVLIDFELSYTTPYSTGVNIYSVGNIGNNSDYIHSVLDHNRNNLHNGFILDNNNKTKKWSINL